MKMVAGSYNCSLCMRMMRDEECMSEEGFDGKSVVVTGKETTRSEWV